MWFCQLENNRSQQPFVLTQKKDSFGIVETFLTTWCSPIYNFFKLFTLYFAWNMKNVLFPGKFEVLTKTGKSWEEEAQFKKLESTKFFGLLQRFQNFFVFSPAKMVGDFYFF